MNRKAFAVLIVLLIAALAPAAAIVGFCTRMPCCHHAPAGPVASSADAGDCCTTITCYETPSAKLASGATVGSHVTTAMMVTAPVALTSTPPRAAAEYVD